MVSVRFNKSNESLYGFIADNSRYWVDNGLIPIGTLRPYHEYFVDGVLHIPLDDVVCIPFQKVGVPLTTREAFNVLCLGGSGDGKGLLMKLVWSVLDDAGFFTVYFDPKSFDAGRARVPWNSSRLAPFVVPKGISLAHYVPLSSVGKIVDRAHHFRKYSMKISTIEQLQFWIGLGMTRNAANLTSKLIQGLYNGSCKEFVGKKFTSLFSLRKALITISNSNDDELPKQSKDNAVRCLDMMNDFSVVNDSVRELDMWDVWTKEGKSVVISLNNLFSQFLTFEVGFRIWQCDQYFFTHRSKPVNRAFANTPIFVFLDDAKFFASNFDPKIVPFNFAIDQILECGFNYRSHGVYNWLSVQTLGIIDETVAESYRHKLISPYFQNPDSLRKINVPKKAIDYLKENVLVREKSLHIIQWLYVTPDNEVIPFFPFTPNCNHFTDIHPSKMLEVVDG